MLEREAALCRSWAEKKRDIMRVYFFGSRVRGTHKPDSDLDVAIVGRDSAIMFDREEWMAELSHLLGLDVRIEQYPHGEPEIHDSITNEGVIVFSRYGCDTNRDFEDGDDN